MKPPMKRVRAWAVTNHGKISLSRVRVSRQKAEKYVKEQIQWIANPALEIIEVEIRPIQPKRSRGKK